MTPCAVKATLRANFTMLKLQVKWRQSSCAAKNKAIELQLSGALEALGSLRKAEQLITDSIDMLYETSSGKPFISDTRCFPTVSTTLDIAPPRSYRRRNNLRRFHVP